MLPIPSNARPSHRYCGPGATNHNTAETVASAHVCQRRWNIRLPERSAPCPNTGASNAMSTPAAAIATPIIIAGESSPGPVPNNAPEEM